MLGSYTAKSGIGTNQISGIDYWTEENQGAYYPRPGSGDDQTIGNTAINVYDGSFIKIKNITLGYTLPKASLSMRLWRSAVSILLPTILGFSLWTVS